MLFTELAKELNAAPLQIKVVRTYIELLGRKYARFAIDYSKLSEYCESAGVVVSKSELRETVNLMAHTLGVMRFDGKGKGGRVYRLCPRLYSGARIEEEEFFMRLQLPRPHAFFGPQLTLVLPIATDQLKPSNDPTPKPRKGKGKGLRVILNGIGGKFKI